nr:AlNc14C172G8041 [Albugo laibachii Nc14]|eukprot:CCA22910.1 AlNc14C172G8041 [Albugo laibachii Nc14]
MRAVPYSITHFPSTSLTLFNLIGQMNVFSFHLSVIVQYLAVCMQWSGNNYLLRVLFTICVPWGAELLMLIYRQKRNLETNQGIDPTNGTRNMLDCDYPLKRVSDVE